MIFRLNMCGKRSIEDAGSAQSIGKINIETRKDKESLTCRSSRGISAKKIKKRKKVISKKLLFSFLSCCCKTSNSVYIYNRKRRVCVGEKKPAAEKEKKEQQQENPSMLNQEEANRAPCSPGAANQSVSFPPSFFLPWLTRASIMQIASADTLEGRKKEENGIGGESVQSHLQIGSIRAPLLYTLATA